MAKQRSKSGKRHDGTNVSPLTASIAKQKQQQQEEEENQSAHSDDDHDIIAATNTTTNNKTTINNPTNNNNKDDKEQRKYESRPSSKKEGSSHRSKVGTMSQPKLMEEAALTALLFGGADDYMGGGSALLAMTASTSTGDNNTNETTSWEEYGRKTKNNNAVWARDEDLFAIDRSGEEILADHINSDENDEEDGVGRDGNQDYEEEEGEEEESMMQDKMKGESNKAMMTGAAWRDSDSEEESHNSGDDEGDHSSIEENYVSDGEEEEEDDGDHSNGEVDDAHTKRISKKQKKGVSLVDGPNRLKKLRRYADETNPLSIKEYELRLRERFITTASVAARTDWADVGLAKQLQDKQVEDLDENDVLISGKCQRKKRSGYESSDGDDDDDYDDAARQILESNASLFDTSTGRGGRRTLPPTILDILRCRDGNLQDPNNSVVSATQFHPNSDANTPLLMTAGLDKMVRFFRIGDGDEGETNMKVHGIQLPQLPVTCASFLGSGELASSVILSGRRPFFYVYDAISGIIQKIAGITGRAERSLERFRVSPDGRVIAFVGNDGYVILVDGKTRQWIGEMKMNGSVRALTFTEDSEYVLGSGSDGDVYRWHIGSRRCVERFHNEDGTITSSLALSSKFLAVGAESGVVNLYNDKYSPSMQFNGRRGGLSLTSTDRTPHKSIMNLTTSADNLCFNSTGDILAMSTKREKNGLKLLHVPSATVFSNWPTSKTPLKYVWSIDFSPGSKYLAVGNDHGKVMLYRLKHYWD